MTKDSTIQNSKKEFSVHDDDDDDDGNDDVESFLPQQDSSNSKIDNGVNNNNNNNNQQAMNSFLASMTFAQQQQQQQSIDDDLADDWQFLRNNNNINNNCDCDTCEETLPEVFRDAIRRHKRIKRESTTNNSATATTAVVVTTSFKRTQERRLLRRHSDKNISIWEWTLPLGAEPMVEFGNSHRLVFVRSMSEHASLQTLGNGIVGSYDEESTRQDLDWKEGCAYIVPSNGGKAVGWYHKPKVNLLLSSSPPNDATTSLGHAVLVMCKIPINQVEEVQCIKDDNDPSLKELTWADTITLTCCQALDRYHNEVKEKNLKLEYMPLPANDAKLLYDLAVAVVV